MEYKAVLKFKRICMLCYAFFSVHMSFFDAIVYLWQYNYNGNSLFNLCMSDWFLDSELSTCLDYKHYSIREWGMWLVNFYLHSCIMASLLSNLLYLLGGCRPASIIL